MLHRVKMLGTSLGILAVLSFCVLYLGGWVLQPETSPRGTQVSVQGSTVERLRADHTFTNLYNAQGVRPTAATVTLSPGWGPVTVWSVGQNCVGDLPDPTVYWQHGTTIAFEPSDCGDTTGIDLTPSTTGRHWFVIRTYESPSQQWRPTYEFKSARLRWTGNVTR